jgi:hypothetical protein
MSGYYFTQPFPIALDNNGNPIQNAKYYFYKTGTSILQNTYSDYALTTVNPNPMLSDGAGRFGDIYPNPILDYKVVLKDANDVIIKTINIFATNTGQTAISVASYGAVGDGITNDTTAINNAIAAGKYIDFGVDKTYLYSGVPAFNGHTIQSMNCKIKVVAGSYSYNAARLLNGSIGNALTIEFTNTVAYTATGASYSGSAKAYDVTLSGISSTTGISVNDFILIRTSTTSSDKSKWIHGAWKVKTVTSTTLVITNTYHKATPPTLAGVTQVDIEKLPTKVQFTGCDGFRLQNSSYLNFSGGGILVGDWDVAAATGTTGTHGIVINAPLIVGGASSNVTVNGGGGIGSNADICLYGWGEQGIAFEGCSSVSANFIVSCANRKRGLYSSGGSSGRCKFSITHGNGEDGVIADEESNLAVSLGSSCGNGLNGYWSTSNSFMNAATTIAIGNLTSGYEARGQSRLLADLAKSYDNTFQGFLSDGGYLDADNGIADGNGDNGFLAGSGGIIDADNSTSTNNTAYGYEAEFMALIRIGTPTVSGNGSGNYKHTNGSQIIVSGSALDYNWQNFPVLPVFDNVTYTNNGTTATYKIIDNNTLFWKISMNYTGLDTADLSTLTISNFPKPMSGRRGNVTFNIRRSTGLTLAAGDTYRPEYNTIDDKIIFITAGASLMAYNSGKIAASGVIEISGWYEI